MRAIALCSRLRRARDWNSSWDELCRPTRSGDLATRTKSPTSPRYSPFRSLRLLHFLSQTSAQANRMLWSAHPESPSVLVRGSALPIVEEGCGGWCVTTGHLLFVDEATGPFSATSHYGPQVLSIERGMKRSACLSPSETDAGSAEEEPAERETGWRRRSVQGSPPGRRLLASDCLSRLGTNIQSFPYASTSSRAPCPRKGPDHKRDRPNSC